MRISIVTPAAKGSHLGNRVTALRMAGLLRSLGHCLRVRSAWLEEGAEVLFALHGGKSAEALELAREQSPDCARVLVLTGTDIYGGLQEDSRVMASMRQAHRIVALQSHARDCVPREFREKTRVIAQSACKPARIPDFDPEHFDVCVLAHMRSVKDPLLTARAARAVPATSRLRVVHVGGALDDEHQRAAEAERRDNPRFHWLGDRPRREALETLASSRLLALTSHNEGGPAVVTEAIACGIPIVSTRFPAAEALLGSKHPGFFPIGDVRALTALLLRCEADETFLSQLRECSEALQPTVDPRLEARALERLLDELLPTPPASASIPRP